MIRLNVFPVQTGHARVSFYDQFTVTRRSSGRGHGGIDIGSRINTRIVAATSGHVPNSCVIGGDTVPGCGYRRSSGNYVVIVDPRGYFFYYFHLEKLVQVSPGQAVESGRLIGTMGNSGLTHRSANAPVHLHFQAVNHLRRHRQHEQWYRDLVFPVRNLNNLNPYRELERLALRLRGAQRLRSRVQNVQRNGVLIEASSTSQGAQ